MALVKCTICGHKISSKAHRCPKCGDSKRDHNSGAEIFALQPDPVNNMETSSPPEVSKAVPPQPEKQKIAEEWYFVTPLGRNGPVNFDFMQQLVTAGQISSETKIWKAGLQDWVKFSHYKEVPEDPTPPEPPPIIEKTLSNVYIWALALAPVWGAVLQIIATEARITITHKTLDYYAQMWWIVVVINIIVSYLDMRYLKKSGQFEDTIDDRLCLLIPVYIYQRDRITHAGMKRLWIWIGSVLLSVAALMVMNSMYSQISSE